MAATTYSGLVIPELWDAYVPAHIAEVAKLIGSAAVQRDPNPGFSKSGVYNYRPFWKEFATDMVIPTANTNLTINPLTTDKDVLVCLHRAIAVGDESNASRRAGANATQEFLKQQTVYFAKQLEDKFYSLFTGVFSSGGALATSHVYDGSGSTIDGKVIFSAKQKLGDNADSLAAIVMHSKVYFDMLDSGLVAFINAADLGKNIALTGQLPTFAGMQIIVTDRVPQIGGAYASYLLGENSLYFAQPYFKTTVGHDDLLAGGTDYAVVNTDFCVHIPGVKFAAASETNPTDATIETTSSWSKVGVDKDIHIVQLLTK